MSFRSREILWDVLMPGVQIWSWSNQGDPEVSAVTQCRAMILCSEFNSSPRVAALTTGNEIFVWKHQKLSFNVTPVSDFSVQFCVIISLSLWISGWGWIRFTIIFSEFCLSLCITDIFQRFFWSYALDSAQTEERVMLTMLFFFPLKLLRFCGDCPLCRRTSAPLKSVSSGCEETVIRK